MTDTRSLGADELRRLQECAREPIRTPGSIQSHGILIGLDPQGVVFVASENVRHVLGHPIGDVAEPALVAAVANATAVDPVRVHFDGGAYDAIVHRDPERTLIELEPADTALEYARTAVVRAIQRLAAIRDPRELRTAAADEIRAITGFDRVMVYHFYDDEHGEVMADARADDMDRYLGLHFPSSDIPPQARELYITKLSRAIVSTEDRGIPLLTTREDAAAIDLSEAELRSVSPYHLQYMRNMGQASTVSFSLVHDGRLVGMITCAHRTQRRIPALLRRSLEVLANQISLQLASMAEIERLRHAVDVRERRAALLAPLFASDDVAGTLLNRSETVLDLVPSHGVVVALGGVISTLGHVPPPEVIDELLRGVGSAAFETDSLARDRVDLSVLMPDIAGLLVIPLGEPGNVLLFFRNEAVREVDWLGDMTAANRPDPLSPRQSFAAWRQSVSGMAEPWGEVVGEALELGRELEGAVQRRAEARLAELAMRDALTGLRNRRYLVDELERVLRGSDQVSLLFVDLDDFKAINDGYGHDAGDAVLVEVGRRLAVNSRSLDSVARLGGDEFVVICEGVTAEDAREIAERVVHAVCEPIAVRGQLITVTASCGVVSAGAEATGSTLLERADAAMYRAKAAGRNRVAR